MCKIIFVQNKYVVCTKIHVLDKKEEKNSYPKARNYQKKEKIKSL